MKRYRVWSDSESSVEIEDKEFSNLDKACDFASDFVHQYDGKDAERVILYVEDNRKEETIGVYENINKCDY